MKISVVGCGWYGKALGQKLAASGYEVYGSTRTASKKEELERSGIHISLLNCPDHPGDDLIATDLFILNIPPFDGQLDWIKSWDLKPETPVFFISSTSVYGSDSGLITEEESPLPSTAHAIALLEQEQWVQKNFTKWNIFRFGGLVGANRHPGKYLSGRKNVANKLWPVNLLHLDDAVDFTIKLIEKKLYGEVYNLVSDEHSTREAFYQDFCSREGLPLPEFDPEDQSVGKTISNEKSKTIYKYKWSKMIGRVL